MMRSRESNPRISGCSSRRTAPLRTKIGPDARYGEEIMAWIKVRPGSTLDLDQFDLAFGIDENT